MKSLVSSIIMAVLIFNFPVHSYGGTGSTGGGEPRGLQFIRIAQSLTNIIAAKSQEFPEINLNELNAFLKVDTGETPFEIQLEKIIEVNGAPKMARFDIANNKIYLDPIEWDRIENLINISNEIDRKYYISVRQSLVLHEILGLMKIEKNNDYRVSNRLILSEVSSLLNLKSSKNLIISTSYNDPSIIYWREGTTNGEKSLTFYFCEDKNNYRTCKMLGSRSYTVNELNKKSKEYKNIVDGGSEKIKDLKNKISSKWWITPLSVLIGIIAFAILPIIGVASSATFLASLILGVGGFGLTKHLSYKFSDVYSMERSVENLQKQIYATPKTYQIFDIKENHIKFIKKMSEDLNSFLLEMDTTQPIFNLKP